jgi:integrase
MAKAANGEGSIRENKARKRWEGRVTIGMKPDGTPVRKMVTGSTKAATRNRMREIAQSADEGVTLARRDLTVNAFLADWLETLPGTIAPSTETQYRDVVRLYIVPSIGRKRVRTLQPADVAKMLRHLEDEGRAPNTRRLARSVLRRALRWGEHNGAVTRNVASLANGVKVGRPQGRTLTPDQARTLLAHVRDDRLEAAYTVALALGLRRGELLALAWGDLDLDGTPPRLTVTRNLTRVHGKGLVLAETKTAGSQRTVHLPGPVVDALRRHRARVAEERLVAGPAWTERPLGADLIFRTPMGTALDPNNFRRLVYKATREAFTPEDERPTEPGDPWPAEYQWSPHELRHSAASLLIAQGVPLKLVSETLGHSSIRITADVYGHLLDEAGAIPAAAMADALWGEA